MRACDALTAAEPRTEFRPERPPLGDRSERPFVRFPDNRLRRRRGKVQDFPVRGRLTRRTGYRFMAPRLLVRWIMVTDSAPIRQYPTVRLLMTPAPHTIDLDLPIVAAHELMRHHQIRHLPVLKAGRIVGMVTERDILLVESLPGIDPTATTVERAMVEDVFTVAPDAPIGEVIETMIEHKLGSAVVCEGELVVGVFTTIDALRALHRLLERDPAV